MIRKIWAWMCSHKDWAHFIGGFGFGFLFGVFAAISAAITAEIKDVQWGGSATLMDAVLTIAGGIIGTIPHYIIISILL